jgi:two-component system nitrate/nitrite response regulator NarL
VSASAHVPEEPVSGNVARRLRCHAGGAPLRCLIVDDNASVLKAAAGLLEREGLTVVGGASNGADALTRARELSPDVILLDIVLGVESGFDVARSLVEAEGHSARIILISTRDEADFADLIDSAPVAGFVAKSDLSASAVERLALRP